MEGREVEEVDWSGLETEFLERDGNAEFEGGLAVLGLMKRWVCFSRSKKGHLVKLAVWLPSQFAHLGSISWSFVQYFAK